jgi:hypothetical protein
MAEHFNACLQLPSTPWLWLIHDDDELTPQAINKMNSFLAGGPDVGIIVAGVQNIDNEGNTVQNWNPKVTGILRGEDALLRLGLDFGAFSPSTVFRVEASHQIGGFADINGVAADYTFAVRLAYSYGIAFLPEVMGRWYIGPRQATDFSTPDKAEAFLEYSVRMAELVRTVGCSSNSLAHLTDYMIWVNFRTIMPGWLVSHPAFVFRLCKKYLRRSPECLEWQNRMRKEYPFLFSRRRWIIWRLFRAAKALLPAALRQWLRIQQQRLSARLGPVH